MVLIGDILLPVTHDYAYGHKIFSVFPGIVIAITAGKSIFDLIKSNILDYVKSERLTNDSVSTQRFLISMSKISRQKVDKISNQADDVYGKTFDILIALSGTLVDGISSLRWMFPNGEFVAFSNYADIGSDSPHSAVFLKKLFRGDMSMEEAAELGYFLIKYIERVFNLCKHCKLIKYIERVFNLCKHCKLIKYIERVFNLC